MNVTVNLFDDRSQFIAGKVADAIAHFGGRLQCRQCGARERLVNQIVFYLVRGWPMCCGETMEWLTDDQLDEMYGPNRLHCSLCGKAGHTKARHRFLPKAT